MSRRSLLKALSTAFVCNTLRADPSFAHDESWKQGFAKALKKNPWLLGFKGTQRRAFPQIPLKVKGSLPEGLRGVFYRNGPARHEVGQTRYHHWFDGDGMVHAFRFTNSHVTHEGRFVETEKYLQEQYSDKPLRQTFGTALPSMMPVMKPDGINAANINIVSHNGELLALWEGGSAYKLDPQTLETLGLKSWSPKTQGAPFSAHPRIDIDGTLWNFGYAPPNGLVIYRISPQGILTDTGFHRLLPVSMVHDFVITQNYLIFILPPFTFDPEGSGSFLDRFQWTPHEGGRALIIEKNDLSRSTTIDIPPFWVFHFDNSYEERGNLIRFQAPLYDTPDIMTTSFRDVMRGEVRLSTPSQMASCSIDLAKKTFTLNKQPNTLDTEFPRIDPRYGTKKHRYTYLMQNSRFRKQLGFNALVRLDNETGNTASFVYPSNTLADEHLFVPDPQNDKEGQGWVIGTALDHISKQTHLNVFRADSINDGPIATMEMNYVLPLGLHGNFAPT